MQQLSIPYREIALIITPVGGDEAANMNGEWHMFDIFPEKMRNQLRDESLSELCTAFPNMFLLFGNMK